MTRQEHVEEIMRYMLNGHFRAYRFAITKWKRARIAARLAEVRTRTVAWRLAGTGWTPGGGEQPLWVTP